MNQEKNTPAAMDTAVMREVDDALAKLALKSRFVTEEQVSQAVSRQRREREKGRNLPLGQVLLEESMITPKQLNTLQDAVRFMDTRQADAVFGKALIKLGLADHDRVEEAFQAQKAIFRTEKKIVTIGDIFVRKGVISAAQRDAIAGKLRAGRKREHPEHGQAQGGTGENEAAGPPVEHPVGAEQPVYVCPPPEDGRDEQDTGKSIFEDAAVDLTVSSDNLRAYLRIKSKLPEGTSADTIKDLLQSKGIRYGLVDDTILGGILKFEGLINKPNLVAEGKPPVCGKDAEVRYFFETEPPRLKLVDDNAKVDFRDRGRVPETKAGTLLVEKTSRIKESGGIDVYGRPIPVAETRDVKLLLGSGVTLSEDGLKVYAGVDGRPDLSPYGKISVFPELNISGDIDFETGNIEFDGCVNVSGTVQDGFKVRAGSLTAKEIARADIDVAGDVTVYGGILGATIKSGRNVGALHVYSSRIEALGDVTVDRGVVDSRIVTSGKFTARGGKVQTCQVAAKMGIEAAQIGSERSKPCALVVGLDDTAHKEVARLKDSLAVTKAEKKKLERDIEELREASVALELRIGELVQLQDRSAREKRAIEEEMAELNGVADAAQMEQVRQAMEELDASIASAEQELTRLFDEQDGIKEQVAAGRDKVDEVTKRIEELDSELEGVIEWIQKNPPERRIEIHGTIFAGTTIRGTFSSMMCKMNYKGVVISEGMAYDPLTQKELGYRFKVKEMS